MGYRKKIYKIGKAAEKGEEIGKMWILVLWAMISILGGIAKLAKTINKATKNK